MNDQFGESSSSSSASRPDSLSLHQLINKINALKDEEVHLEQVEDDGFISLRNSSELSWVGLFIHYFLTHDYTPSDDLLFFVRKQPSFFDKFKTSFKPQPQLDVYRKDSKKLPIGDLNIDWQQTLYMNTVMQLLEYSLTCAICTRTSSREFQILAKHRQKVYASPSHRSMHIKGETEEITYPAIYFTLDDYEEMMKNIPVRSGEMVCIELVAHDKHKNFQLVIFSGSIDFETIRHIHEMHANTKWKRRMKIPINHYFGDKRLEFIRMKGPMKKGIAEMAFRAVDAPNIRRFGSNISLNDADFGFLEVLDIDEYKKCSCLLSACCLSTNSSSAQDQDFFRRRMSDPSNDLEKRLEAWKGRPIPKSRSENQVSQQDDYGVNEIEATDFSKEMKEGDQDNLWNTPGFNQIYHSWKENRRANLPTFQLFITYITIPIEMIVADFLSSYHQKPILSL
ncbi:uncharacterized protein KIAA0930 homolog isoform X2 [Brevipalpus obovatus]|uniref:uncharacterized protein KIAA0930 homolog isoform X2 n=1 Tax=Brevipalpus obovatus TaxID=246614 RepID=UPI003D9F2307